MEIFLYLLAAVCLGLAIVAIIDTVLNNDNNNKPGGPHDT